jgi:hypothetical protein
LILIAIGTKTTGAILGDIRKRLAKASKLIKEYNDKVKELPPDTRRPQSIDSNGLNTLLLADSALWDLDRFQCNDKWALHPPTRTAISSLANISRAQEEVSLLVSESLRFLNWNICRLDNIERILRHIEEQSIVSAELLIMGSKSAKALESAVGMDTAISRLCNLQSNEDELLDDSAIRLGYPRLAIVHLNELLGEDYLTLC